MKRYMITGVADNVGCPLCIQPTDGRAKAGNGTIFQVTAEGGGYSGPICPPHLAALIKMDEKPKPVEPVKAAAAQPANGPHVAVPAK